jgi:xanthine dehydrogenase YagS FAD-binding subunit
MRAFAYSSATELDAAVARLDGDTVRPLAGGTDLLTLIKGDIVTPIELIDIKRAGGLHDRIEITDVDIVLGALVTLAQIEHHAGLRERAPALVEAAALAASPQLRNMATIGGNLLQRPRCWYYRSSRFHCWLKGGEECFARGGENQQHALFGESPCVAVHPSDPAAALMAFDASVAVHGPAGDRVVPLGEFLAAPSDERRTETTLARNEIVTEIRVPAPAAGSRSAYLKAMDRKVWAFALAGCAAVARIEHGAIADARIVLTGVAPVPWRATEAEAVVIGQPPSEVLFGRAAAAALSGARPLAKNGYKLPLAEALVRRALASVTTGG